MAHISRTSESVLCLSKDLAPHRGHRRQVHVAGVAEIWDSTMPVKLNSVSTGPNPFISKQKQNHTGFAWYFPPNAHNTDRAFLRRLHSSGAGNWPVERLGFLPSIALLSLGDATRRHSDS